MQHVIHNAATKETVTVSFTAEELAAWQAKRPDPKLALMTHAYTKRRAVVDAGFVVMVGETFIPVWADADSLSSMQGLLLAAQLDPQVTTTWKGRDGAFYQIDAAGIKAMTSAVLAFVQQAFAIEAEMIGAINSGVITTTNQINGGNWPANG